MFVEFTKMQGLGNDYIYINCIEHEYENLYQNIPKICDRHFGIGADGVILILKSTFADFKMRIFNADGSEAQMCGNGIRCVGKYLYDKKISKKKKLNIETLCGIKELELEEKNGIIKNVKVDMGEPRIDTKNSDYIIKINNQDIPLNYISMGNPHAVTVSQNIDELDIEKFGPIIENDSHFPERTNVEFVEILDKSNIKMRVWERGSKETLACGTGACAVAVSCNMKGYTNRLVNIYLLGGVLTIYWDENDNHVYMKGPAQTVFEGKIIIN